VDFFYKKNNMDEIIAGQENFNLPHDIVQLPSQGKFYRSKKKVVKVGYLTAADENLLANVSKLSGEQLILRLVRSKLYEPDMNPSDMLEGDIEAILIFLRNTSFGSEYSFTLTDPDTGNRFEKTVTLDELSFKKGEVDPDENGYYRTKLPKSGAEVKLKPLTYGESTDLEKMVENYPSNLVAPKVTWRLNKQIVELNGNSDRGEIAKFIETMPIMDSKYISTFLRDNEPRINLTREVNAPSGKKLFVRVTFGAEFFRPFF
jgi:hypothetical protein